MIFQHTWEKVLSGEKTQTRRIVKPGDTVWGAKVHVSYDAVKSLSGRAVYEVGKDYAVQPGRGQKAVARIRILSIRREDVRTISDADVKAEGWKLNDLDPVTAYPALWYLRLWASMHDDIAHVKLGLRPLDTWRDYLNMRPAGRYDAWAIEFEVVK